MEKAKQMGIDCYHEEQREKVALLHRLLDEFDDGEHDVFFCLAANLLAVPDLEGALVRAGAKACGGEAHERAACAEAELRHVARERGIALELRTWDGPW